MSIAIEHQSSGGSGGKKKAVVVRLDLLKIVAWLVGILGTVSATLSGFLVWEFLELKADVKQHTALLMEIKEQKVTLSDVRELNRDLRDEMIRGMQKIDANVGKLDEKLDKVRDQMRPSTK